MSFNMENIIKNTCRQRFVITVSRLNISFDSQSIGEIELIQDVRIHARKCSCFNPCSGVSHPSSESTSILVPPGADVLAP